MKKQFWKSFFDVFINSFKAAPVFFIIVAAIYLATPVSLSFLSWYSEMVEGVIVSKDPKAYPYKYKQTTEYNYYAKVYFPSDSITKNVEIHEVTHQHALQGQVYMFPRNHKLQTGSRNLYMFISVINISISILVSIVILIIFISKLNSFFSVNNEEETTTR